MIARIWRGWTTPENADTYRRIVSHAFAGEDHEAAYVPSRSRAVLARFDERSTHYDTLLRPHTR